ncbi:ATP synthase delta chain [Granulibacter bethesdensis]|uniref:ATP synthase subunit delta n=1 Tax=Granulibacter bethesdensis TaxID=364410 RepID=A0AAC9KBI1_9PROT|nr:ATP synthase delta chain [Granulibacter bethesdensis]APH62963.1 ATP synthase delta chain [Granulibacter bethesdensis]
MGPVPEEHQRESETVASNGANESGAAVTGTPQREAKHVSGTAVSGLAKRYASALYSYAEDSGDLDGVIARIDALGRLIDQSADLQSLLGSPLVDVNRARDAVLAVLDRQGFTRIERNFVGTVANNRRLGSLRSIISAFAVLVAEKRGESVALVESAHPLTEVQEHQLRASLIEAGYGNVRIEKHVDPSLLGGLVVRIGTRLYDTSLKSRLQRLQYAMKGAA